MVLSVGQNAITYTAMVNGGDMTGFFVTKPLVDWVIFCHGIHPFYNMISTNVCREIG
jgi:hypothetical protein